MSLPRAFLFPGQGAQEIGMGVDLAATFPEAARVFEKGGEILGLDVLAVCRDGPASLLNSTKVSQPAIFLHSMAVLEALGTAWRASGPFCRGVPALGTAGLSLGEYSALVFAGSLEFEDAVRVVGRRGELMQDACERSEGTMAAVIGLSAEKVEAVVDAASQTAGLVQVANYNSPRQTVISGEVAAVKETAERLKAAGARRVVPLTVGGAFHSKLMAPAARELEVALQGVTIRPPRVPFFSNVTGGEVDDPEAIRKGLVEQVESSVRWTQLVGALVDRGMQGALEPGPGKVLQGLVRSISRGTEVVPAGTAADVEALAAGPAGGVGQECLEPERPARREVVQE